MNHPQRPALVLTLAVLLTLPLTLFAENVTERGGGAVIPVITHTGETKAPQSGLHPALVGGNMSTSSGKDTEGGGMRGGRMMASDTRQLPPGVDKLILKRDSEAPRMSTTSSDDTRVRGRMLGTSTPKSCLSGASSTDCAEGREKGATGMRERMGEHRGDIFKHSGEMILKRMHAALDRFTKLADRMDSRITKLHAAGSDTDSAAAALLLARTKISVAHTTITDAETAINMVAANLSAGTSTSPSESEKKPAKDALEKARQAILVAGQALHDVMPLLSGTRSESTMREHASSTMATGTIVQQGDSH